MGLLDRFEQRLDQLVNGAFARAFKSEVQPVEIASAFQREMDDRAAIVSRGRTVVPNVFHVELSPHDHERLSMYADALRGELADMVRQYAEEQRYTFLGNVDVALDRDDELETGIFRVRSEAKAAAAGAPSARRVASAGAVAPVPGGVGTVPTSPRLVVAGVPYPLARAVTVIGRGTDVDLRVDDPGVSRRHAEVTLAPGAPVLRDLGSTNGTYLDGVKVSQAALYDGATVTVGTTTMTYRAG